MARGAHTSPQRTKYNKRRKSILKAEKRMLENNTVLRKFRQQSTNE